MGLPNEKVLNHIKKLPKERFIVRNYKDLINNDQSTRDTLIHHWGFHLENIPFSSVFKRQLLSERSILKPT